MSKKSEAGEQAGRPVLVTTAHRGVFFGYANGDTSGPIVELNRARNCVYWSAEVKGFMGLASTGPTTRCRVGPPADIELRDITSVVSVTPEAVERWESAPWS